MHRRMGNVPDRTCTDLSYQSLNRRCRVGTPAYQACMRTRIHAPLYACLQARFDRMHAHAHAYMHPGQLAHASRPIQKDKGMHLVF